MALAALGVVYGDIGTSPLYTFKTAIAWAGGEAAPAAALGMLSLIVWTLIITTSIKYVAIALMPLPLLRAATTSSNLPCRSTRRRCCRGRAGPSPRGHSPGFG